MQSPHPMPELPMAGLSPFGGGGNLGTGNPPGPKSDSCPWEECHAYYIRISNKHKEKGQEVIANRYGFLIVNSLERKAPAEIVFAQKCDDQRKSLTISSIPITDLTK